MSASKVNSKTLIKYKIKECLIIDDFENEIDENLLFR